MFWRFTCMPSKLITLLENENITLLELMDEDDIVQECKSQNKKLIDFVTTPENIDTLVHMIVDPPSGDVEDKTRYRYPNVACEIITCDVPQITDALSTTASLMETVYSFLDTDGELNPLQASFFSKVMGLLITRKSEMMLEFLKSRDNFIDRLLQHIGVSAIMDLLLRLITCIESTECRNSCIVWLSEQQLVQRLVGLIDPVHSAEQHANAAQSLCDIIRLSREQISQLHDVEGADALLMTVETQETVSELLDHMLNGSHVESAIVNGLYVIQTLLETRKSSPEGLQEHLSIMDTEQLSSGVVNAVNAVVARLKDFHEILLNPPRQHYLPMPTSCGLLDVPLGQTRLQVTRLLSALISTNFEQVHTELASLGTISVLMNLFFTYTWNNFLHSSVEQCVSCILSSASPNSELRSQLLKDFDLLSRVVESFEDSKCTKSGPCHPRKGYLGHVTRIANQLVNYSTSDTSLLQDLPESVQEKWNECVLGSLAETNKVNTTELVGGSAALASSSDDDDEFRSISFPQDDALQKAFVEYQQQKMTTEFIEQFGFNEDEFAELEECIGSPFNERISGINFELSTVEDSPTAAAMFEHACSDRIRQFDSTDSDEDLWEDKEPSFGQLLEGQHSSAVRQNQTNVAPSTATNGAADSDGEESGDDRSTDESEPSDESDPELDSPHCIRQTYTGEVAKSTDEVTDTSHDEANATVSETANSVISDETLSTDRNDDEHEKEKVNAEINSNVHNADVALDDVKIDLLSILQQNDQPQPVDLLTITDMQADNSKLESMKLPCLIDARSGSDAALTTVHNGSM